MVSATPHTASAIKTSAGKSRGVKSPGEEAIKNKGWLRANKWLLLRRLSQLGILSLFLAGPLFSVWIIKGNMSSSLLLDVLPLSDPFVLLQTLLAGHVAEASAISGALLVAAFYFLVGGRVYCSWVCPINIVTDIADWMRRKLNIKSSLSFSRMGRYGLLLAIFIIAAVTGTLAWELINPVTMIQRELVYGMGFSWLLVLAIFVLDAFVSRRAWCGHLCPMGAFYSLIGRQSLIKINAVDRKNCDDCMDCFAICPEPQVIKPALKGNEEISPVIISGNCTNCGRCIDVCAKDVFKTSHRFIK